MQTGYTLRAPDGSLRVITKVDITNAPLKAYNLNVENTDTYFVGKTGVWVHNCDVSKQLGTGPVQPGTEGTYKELISHKRRFGQTEPLEMDKQPSLAATRIAAEQAKGGKLTSDELKALKENAPAVASPKSVHRDSRTYGGRNHSLKDRDASDLVEAKRLDREKFDKDMEDR